MRSEFLDNKSQWDYKDGCIQIVASNADECFELGMLFQKLITMNYDVLKSNPGSKNFIAIRVPLKFITEL